MPRKQHSSLSEPGGEMAKRLSRKELYDLVWSEPLRTLSVQFGISDVALRKYCQRSAIPTPERGYWARKDAGKKTFVPAFPERLPAMEDEVVVGGGNNWHRPEWTREELLGPLPPAPEFDTSLEAVRERIAKILGKVTVPRDVKVWHPAIQRLLAQDDARREKLRTIGYSSDKPLFESPLEMRKLRLLNSLIVAIGKFSGVASPDEDARNVSLSFYKQYVRIALGPAKRPSRDKSPEQVKDWLTLAILDSYNSEKEVQSWHDGEGIRLEMQVTAIAVEVVLLAEAKYRDSQMHRYKWRVERKAELEEEDRRHKLETERAEQERLKRLEQARIDSLLSDAAAFQRSAAIRQYVEAIRARHACSPLASDEELEHWSKWALAQADRVDPAHGGGFLLRMRQTEPPDK
jgi:hypothetical protein